MGSFYFSQLYLSNCSPGDLVLFYNRETGDEQQQDTKSHDREKNKDAEDAEMRDAITAASTVDARYRGIFHAGLVVEVEAQSEEIRIVHASEEGVRVQPLRRVVEEHPGTGRVELCRIKLEERWKSAAVGWALEQCGSGYNDLFSPECVNSAGKRAFYCCQLVVESYKASNPQTQGQSPFLPHTLNFTGHDGTILPFWLDYYRKLCPENPNPPQGRSGSHPSKLRASPIVCPIQTLWTAKDMQLDLLKKLFDEKWEQPLPEVRAKMFDEVRAEAKQRTCEKSELLRLISYIDLTALAATDTVRTIERLVANAVCPNQSDEEDSAKCAAVCVYPARVQDAVQAMKAHCASLPIASVAGGFPSGQYLLETRLLEIQLAVRDGAAEIDTVLNRSAALEGDWESVLHECIEMKRVCDGAHLKVILATGELGSEENIFRASMAAMFGGADFIKTSTGKETVNATLDSALVMCSAIRRHHELTGLRVGFKAAGGIRTAEEAMQYALLVERLLGAEWTSSARLFRIGASSLLDDIRAKLAALPKGE